MIHKFTLYGTNMVVDVNSGAVHIFDEVAFEVLDYYKKCDSTEIVDKLCAKYEKAQILEAIQELEELESRGELFYEDAYRDYLNLWDRKPVVKALCLHVSHDCNLRCKYCFAATGNFGGERTNMDPEIGKRAIDFLIQQSGNRRNLEIDFFGGEPLLNFEAVKEVVAYALSKEKEHNKKFKFTLTTNALLLNEEHKKYINEHIQNIVLSIDGRAETNDRMRFRLDGSGTYESIIPKIKDLADSRNQDNYYVRGTFTRENLDFASDVLHLADQGFEQISVEPVVAAKGTGYDIREEDLPVLFKEYEKLAYEYVDRRKSGQFFNFFHFMIDLSQGPCVAKRLGGCGSGHEYLAITPEGDIYPCHQFVGMDEFKMGNVNEATLDDRIQNKFKDTNIYTKPECVKCWAKFYCSGGCAANSYQFHNDINIPYSIGCELEKKRVECALWIKTQE
ncbi:MAG: thioether cross-link-forming SCIFF peptide maturase [Clostridia bacterium]|nr:thioether cross-link-forming SCIFF peptide maturase [Clostridia bacterium]